MFRLRNGLVGVAVVALAASVAAPAAADKARFHDDRGDLRGRMDVRSVTVDNNGRWISVRTRHGNIRRHMKRRSGGVAVYLDTVRRRRGPEFMMSGPVGFNGDYGVMKMRRWKQTGNPLRCRMRFHVNYRRNVVRIAVKRRCLDRAYDHRVGRIRVAVRASQGRPHGQPRIDWAPKRRHFYPWVRRN